MGQQEILDFLKENKGIWFTAKQIREAIGISSSSHCLRILREHGFVLCKPIHEGNWNKGYLYQHKEE